MIKACIFDLDGVIVDTAKYHFIAWQELAESQGISFTETENEQLKGVGRMESLEYILSLGDIQKSDSEKLALAAAKNTRYVELIAGLNPSDMLTGVKTFLDELKTHNIKIALGSSSKNARPVLDYLGIRSMFDVIVDGTNINKSKPDPQVFNMGASQLGIESAHAVVFEDAKAGIEAAINGGFMSVGVGEESELGAADFVIENFEDFNFEKLKNALKQKYERLFG